jgi:hypothetical protein
LLPRDVAARPGGGQIATAGLKAPEPDRFASQLKVFRKIKDRYIHEHVPAWTIIGAESLRNA